ncbi:hypothetical protein OPQ81_003391 [Rhizoctonia solani]|nr:hypothetical protein OPQ81_003391 [Rhizoctonia solani]
MSSPTFMHADPSALTIPNDSNGVIQALKEIKDLLVAMNNNLSVVIGQTAAHHADISTAATTLGNHDSGITNLESAMVKLMADIARISGAAVGSATAGSKAPKLALPDKFDGSDKNKAVSFRVAVSHYLRVSYPGSTVDEQIAFIISCLDGKAHEWLEPYLEDDEVKGNPVSWLHDVAAFWVQFNARWNVQNRTENFRAKLRALKQTKGVQEYFKDFQVYSQGLGYNDVSLRDMFYDGLTIKIKEMLMAQDFDHSEASVTLQTLAEKALKIDQRLEQFAAQNKGTSSGQSGSKSNTLPSPAAPGSSREKLSVGEKVYVIVDGKAKKGTLSSIGKNSKGVAVPTVKWDDGSFGESTFKSLKKDNHPITPTPAPAPKSSSSSSRNSGPAPMDLDSVGRNKKPVICSTCGGKGHYASQCPSKSFSGHEANLSGDESEKEDL